MDDDIIEALADGFAWRFGQCEVTQRDTHYGTIMEDCYMVAVVIHNFEPTYDLRYYYKRAGFPEPYPIHEM